jgi:hypothetical protein
LWDGTPHAKLKTIKGFQKVGFKPKQPSRLAILEVKKGWNGLRNHEIGKWGK